MYSNTLAIVRAVTAVPEELSPPCCEAFRSATALATLFLWYAVRKHALASSPLRSDRHNTRPVIVIRIGATVGRG